MSMECDFMVKIVGYPLNVQFSVHYYLYHNTGQTYWTTPANPELHDTELHVYMVVILNYTVNIFYCITSKFIWIEQRQ